MLVDEAWRETCGTNALPIEVAEGENRVLCFRMKWVRGVLRVRLEPEPLAPAFGPRAPLRAGVPVDVQGFGCDREITQAMEDRSAAINLHALQDVGVVPNHHIRTSIDCTFRDLSFVHADGSRRVAQPLMQRDGEHVDLCAKGLNVSGHRVQRFRFGKRVYRRWSAWRRMVEFVMREHVNIGAASARISSPGFPGAHAVVAQQSEAQAAPFEYRRFPGFGQVCAGAGGENA